MSLITWHEDYPGSARRTARLGEITVGAVIAGETTAQWITWLPNHHGSSIPNWKYVKTEDQARAALVSAVTDWLRRAGILSLAERDRVDATSLPLFAES